MRRQYRLKGETLLGKTIRASMSRRSSRANGESYFAVEFEVTSEGKYARQIADFRQQHYSPAMFRLLSGPKKKGDGSAETGTAETGSAETGTAETGKGKKK